MFTVFVLAAVLLTAAIVAYRYETSMVVSLPVCTGGLILVLYLLAFFRAMTAVFVIAPALIAAEIIIFARKKKIKNICEKLCSVQNLVVAGFVVLIAVAGSEFKVYWWDDINYWATDAKAMYYLNGFPGKYGNVAPSFGDYPPAVSLFKWVFLKISNVYNEGLAYSGYQILVFLLGLPLLKRLKAKNTLLNIAVQIIGCVLLVLLPTVCNIVCFEGTCAEVVMGLMYGNLICAILSMADNEKNYVLNGFSIAIYSTLIVLTKNVGFEWVAYAIILFFIITFPRLSKEKRKQSLIFWVIPVIGEAGWLAFCLFNRRVAKLTSEGVHMLSGSTFNPADFVEEKIGYFIKGFLFEPMHTNNTGVLDLSAVCFFAVLLVVFAYFAYWKIVEKRQGIILVLYTFATGMLAYGTVFIAHITIFATETQYASSDVMAISMSRYAAPFTVGMLFVAISLVTEKIDNMYIHVICALFILLTCDYAAPTQGLITYRDNLDSIKEGRADMTADATRFMETVANDEQLWGQRVLYLRDGNTVHWVHDTYVNMEVSPVAVVYESVTCDSDENYLSRIIDESHASYVYVDNVEGLNTECFTKVIGADFETEKIYRIR